MVLGMLARRSRWLDYASAVLVGLVALWLAIPTSLFIRPEAIIYDGRTMTLVRETPLGSIDAIWSRELYVAGTHEKCRGPDRLEHVQLVTAETVVLDRNAVAPNTVVSEVEDWELKCLRAEPPIIVTHTWRALLFGVIPLRPKRFVVTIDRSFPKDPE